MTSLSIIIPVYNSELYISRCLDSIFAQTISDIEVICVNDGSSDNSLALLTHYRQKHQNLKIINQHNAGPSAARNAGMVNILLSLTAMIILNQICTQPCMPLQKHII